MKPTENQIKDAIKALKKRLKEPNMELESNAAVKEGYTFSLGLLENGNAFGYVPCSTLQFEQARAIAVLAVDFLDGECTHKVLCNVPIKDK